jgi:RNA polymerase sigma-70 factor (ECF subfamily)
LPTDRIANHQPYWVTRANVLLTLGQSSDARMAADRAIGLTEDAALRDYLRKTLFTKLRD